MGCGLSHSTRLKQRLADFEVRVPAKRVLVNDEEHTLLMHVNNVGPYYVEDINNSQFSYFEHRFMELMTAELNSAQTQLRWESKDAFVQSLLKNTKLRQKFFKFARRKGFDHHYRWTIWQTIVLSTSHEFDRNEKSLPVRRKLYSNLLKMENIDVIEIVNKDILRTSRHKDIFSSISSIGTSLLFNVCKGIGCFYPNIGYVQGMNFIAAFVLEVSGMEEFESWNFIVNFWNKERNLYFGLYDVEFPLLYFLTFCFHKLLKEQNPKLEARIDAMGMPDEMWLIKWFIGMFTFTVKKDFLLRIFDFLMTTDLFGMTYVSLIIAQQLEPEFFKENGFVALAECFQNPEKLTAKLNFYSFVKSLKTAEIPRHKRLQLLEEYNEEVLKRGKTNFALYYKITKNRLESETDESWENVRLATERRDLDDPVIQAQIMSRPSKKDIQVIKQDVVSLTEFDVQEQHFNMDIILQRKMSILSSRFLIDGTEKNPMSMHAI
jgi:hypothetical protein